MIGQDDHTLPYLHITPKHTSKDHLVVGTQDWSRSVATRNSKHRYQSVTLTKRPIALKLKKNLHFTEIHVKFQERDLN